MSAITLRSSALGLAMALLLALATLVATGTSDSADAATQSTMRRSEPIGRWHCKPFKSRSVVGKTCARFTVFDEKFDIDYRRSMFNEFRKQTVPFTCRTSKQTTWKFGVSATVKAEAGVIFAKAEASTTASVERSVTTTDEASATMKVRPRHWAHCKRGTYVFKIRGEVKRIRCNAGGCRNSRSSFTAQAPSRDVFLVGPGRG
jgi:hypothetical protein